MTSSSKIETSKITILDLFEKFWFEIPNYQRHYIWDVDNVYKLLEDIKTHYELNKFKEYKEEYFIGTLVLQKQENGIDYDVLDGQQRLTTILLIFSVIRDLTNNKNNRDKYLKEVANPDKRIYKDKNRINFKFRDNIGKFCQKYVYDYDKNNDIEQKYAEISEHKNDCNISLKNIANALIAIKHFFEEDLALDEIDNFVNVFLNDVVLIYVSTENKDDALRLFTVLNSRGVPLSNADILKSMNLDAIKDKEKQKLYAKKWEDIEDSFKQDEFDRFLSHIRAILIKQKARATLLNEFENIIYNKDNPLLSKGLSTIDFIERYYNIYRKLVLLDEHEQGSTNKELGIEYKNLINILNAAFSSTDWIPPLLVYYDKFKETRLLEFLKRMEEKALCDIICRESPTRRMDSFYKIIDVINKSNHPKDILNSSMSPLENYNKNNAINIIKSEGIYGRVFDKYILLKYEYLNQDNSVVISDYSNLSIEHVLPQNPKDDSQWIKDFTAEERAKWKDNIANLIIISGRKNASLSNLDFCDKKNKLQNKIKDIFSGSAEVLAKEKWNPKILQERLNVMCDKLFS